jgi:hypothetical protein
MKSAVFPLLALLTGCYQLPGAQGVGADYVQRYPNPPGIPAGTPSYVIDSGISANVPVGAYGITTNGLTFLLAWQSTDDHQRFTGDVYCPLGCYLDNIRANASYGGAIITYTRVTDNHMRFLGQSPSGHLTQLQFDAPTQPVGFDLLIEGQPAITPDTTFPSNHQLSSVDGMPFNLVSSDLVAAH